jgi:hypothetical protein
VWKEKREERGNGGRTEEEKRGGGRDKGEHAKDEDVRERREGGPGERRDGTRQMSVRLSRNSLGSTSLRGIAPRLNRN